MSSASPSSSRKADFEAVVEGLKNLTRDDVPDMYDPALVEMSLEICADAIAAAGPRRAPSSMRRQRSSEFQVQLVRQTLPDRSAQGASRPLSRAALKRT